MSYIAPLPDDCFEIIYADPPWPYKDKAHAGQRGVEYKYAVLTDQEIYDLPVQSISAPNCTLFLWITFPKLREGLKCMDAWGFEYKTVAFVWIKLSAKNLLPFWGMGNWTRSNAEICLLGIKGKPKRINAGVHSVIMSAIRKHSQKPDEARERIVKLMGDRKRIELFARDRTKGWTTWGNQV